MQDTEKQIHSDEEFEERVRLKTEEAMRENIEEARQHNEELNGLLEKGYIYIQRFFPVILEELPEKQRTFIHALSIFDYEEEWLADGAYLTPAAAEIYSGLLCEYLSSAFTLQELKYFMVRNQVELRDDWKTRLELLESAGIETETTDITPGAGAGTSAKPASSPKENAKGDISGFFSIRGLAQRNNIPEYKFEAFEKAVRRWHRDNPESSAVQETTYRNPNQEKWIYKEDVLMHIIKKYQDKG